MKRLAQIFVQIFAQIFAIGLVMVMPAKAEQQAGWEVLSLQASNLHAGSKVWSGKFTGLNGRDYDASDFYKPSNQPFAAKALLAKAPNAGVTWLMPLAVDAGHKARLYQAEPFISLGFGAAISTGPRAMLSMRVDNALRLGGKVSEQPCYDSFRRQYHCGTGLAWTDYTRIDNDRRDAFALPAVKIKYVRRFSF